MDDTEQLNKNLEKLNENLEKQVSLKFVILKGAVYGLGTAIGATIVASILFSLFSATIDRTEQIELIDTLRE